ncbi:MAG: MBL fold metallo-hydrolase [Candidatus Krumholzibacteriota bacterium]|nr:MBL fold metallo-hydrolase [Candidatus Krumholzibacteriota bacterium]
MSFRVTVLGSGTIIPSPERASTSLLVEAEENHILLDCGPDAPRALALAGFPFSSIRHLLLTHYHPDHTLGLGHLVSALRNLREAGEKNSLTFWGPVGLIDFWDRWGRLYPSLASEDRVILREIEAGERIGIGKMEISSARAEHGNQAALSYRISYLDSHFVYSGDTAYNDDLVRLSRKVDWLVSECSFPDDSPVRGHMTPREVGKLAAEAEVKRLLLVHLYPYFGEEDPAGGVRKEFKGQVIVARDGLVIDI